MPPREGNENCVRNFIALLGEQASPPALMEERYFPSSRARRSASRSLGLARSNREPRFRGGYRSPSSAPQYSRARTPALPVS